MLYDIFKNCLNADYVTLENGVDVALSRRGFTLYIYFEHSSGALDWKNNLDFPALPYPRKNDIWYAHRGFLNAWKTALPYIKPAIVDKSTKSIEIAGYSHGAALAVLCHEYAWYHRPLLRGKIHGFGFGCPRVVWGIPPKNRWDDFYVIRNLDDIVTHLPPSALGYTHVGNMIEIGKRGRYSKTDAHRPENILRELKSASF